MTYRMRGSMKRHTFVETTIRFDYDGRIIGEDREFPIDSKVFNEHLQCFLDFVNDCVIRISRENDIKSIHVGCIDVLIEVVPRVESDEVDL